MSELQNATWLCIEDHPTTGFRVTNMPGGPGIGMCFFNGPRSPHLSDCGYVDLEAARRVANLDIEAGVKAYIEKWTEIKPRTNTRECFEAGLNAALGISDTE